MPKAAGVQARVRAPGPGLPTSTCQATCQASGGKKTGSTHPQIQQALSSREVIEVTWFLFYCAIFLHWVFITSEIRRKMLSQRILHRASQNIITIKRRTDWTEDLLSHLHFQGEQCLSLRWSETVRTPIMAESGHMLAREWKPSLCCEDGSARLWRSSWGSPGTAQPNSSWPPGQRIHSQTCFQRQEQHCTHLSKLGDCGRTGNRPPKSGKKRKASPDQSHASGCIELLTVWNFWFQSFSLDG